MAHLHLAVDVGYGYVKAVASDGRSVVFPSVFAPETHDGVWDQAFGTQDAPDRLVWTHDDVAEAFWIGDAARRRPGAQRPWAEAAHDRTGYLLLVDAAIALLAPAPTPESTVNGTQQLSVDVAVGLPLGLFSAQRADLSDLLAQHDATIQSGSRPPVHLDIDHVTVWPQAAGVFYAVALAPNASLSLMHDTVGVVDIGYRTTDYFVMEPAPKGVRPVRTLSGSLELGLVALTERVRQAVEQSTGKLAGGLKIEEGLTKSPPHCLVDGARVSLEAFRDASGRALGQQIADSLRQVWGAALSDFGAVLVAGGGATWLGPAFQAAWPQAQLVPEPLMANARGFLASHQLSHPVPGPRIVLGRS